MDDLWGWYIDLWGEATHSFVGLVALVALSAIACIAALVALVGIARGVAALGQAFAKGWRSGTS